MKTDGTIVMELKDVLERWKEYIIELSDDVREEREYDNEIIGESEGPAVLKDEIQKAVKKMK